MPNTHRPNGQWIFMTDFTENKEIKCSFCHQIPDYLASGVIVADRNSNPYTKGVEIEICPACYEKYAGSV
jgi:hypothetical protein